MLPIVYLLMTVLCSCAAWTAQVYYLAQQFTRVSSIHQAITSPRDDSNLRNLLIFWDVIYANTHNMTGSPLVVGNGKKLSLFNLSEHHDDGVMRQSVSYNPSKQCFDGLVRLGKSVAKGEIWALQVLDAIAKPPSGLLMGDIYWLGSFDECVNAKSNYSMIHPGNITKPLKGSYYVVSVFASNISTNSTPIELGACVPSTCTSSDTMTLFNLVLSVDPKVKARALKADFKDDASIPLDTAAIAVICILSVISALLFFGTLYDIVRQMKTKRSNKLHDDDDDDDHLLGVEDDENDGGGAGGEGQITVQNITSDGTSSQTIRTDHLPIIDVHVQTGERIRSQGYFHDFLMSFSILANMRKILTVEATSGTLQSIHGIRFLSMAWVILGHSYFFSVDRSNNVIEILDVVKRFSFQAIFNATVSVDTFFLLSGSLVSYLLLNEIKRVDGLRNVTGVEWAKFFFHRFWRLTPLYMLVLAIYATLFKYFGNGPYWSYESDSNCQRNWWTNLLYINNIVRNQEQCLGWTWYLADDMQFFLLSPIFIACLYKWALLGYIVTFIFLLASFITTGVMTYVNDLPPDSPGILQDQSKISLWFTDIYMVPWCRIGPYLIGILLGYALHKTNGKIRMRLSLVALFWCIAIACGLAVVYGLYGVSNGHFLTSSLNAFYASVHRTVWAVAVAWVIFACVTGYAGYINDLLSWSGMVPLSRLTFAAYLVHPLVMTWYGGNLRVPLYMEDSTMIHLFLGFLFLSYAIAFVLSVAFEAPMIALEKCFWNKKTP